ncbi:ABC transporter substrate-binding protein [Dethiosulfatarculus sandiegensis]|uniref:Ethanolamine utilization protein EutJ n=1 Tax=Dethiosulfatarculus sandiegensis TaxID=1429043 RepID=A0A0D2JZY8_9BACT|nr:ABC transporter substrate-binding protein [Dethiosulfatarculus sandiegensis]KIX15065.1 ethanolamine utilization protein EutJ [Dethiosulfatarculus sandiegensis]
MRNIALVFSILLLLSGVAAHSAYAADSIKIAAIFGKSGEASKSTIHHFQAVRYAVDELNRLGGVLGKNIEVIELDNHSSPIQSKLAAKKAVRLGVTAVIGCSWSDHSLAVAKVLQKQGIPMITPDSTNPAVTKVGDYIFRVAFVDTFQGRVLAEFASQTLHAQNAVIIQCIDSAYSMGLSRTFQEKFKGYGKKILGVFNYKQTQKDFSSIIKKSKKLNPDLLLIPGYDESGLIVKQAQELGIDAVMLGGDGWSYREFFAKGGMELKKGYYTCHWTKDVDSPKSKNFVKNYQRTYEVNESAALTYDAVMILAQAIQNAGSLDRKKIRSALASLSDFVGVTGQISFNETGNPDRPAIVMEITSGKSQFLQMVK